MTRAYARGVLLLSALLPGVAIVYIRAHQLAQDRFLHHGYHELAIAVASVLGGFITWVTWLCYRATGEAFLWWLGMGLWGCTLIYACHGLFTPLASCNLGLFLIYGPVSRLVLAFCLLVGLWHYRAPVDSSAVRSRLAPWLCASALFVVLDLGLAAVFSGQNGLCLESTADSSGAPAGEVRRYIEWCALSLNLANVVLMRVKRVSGSLMTLYVISLALFVQSSISFLQAKAWDHQWWLAHAIFAGGFLLLSYGVVQAFHSSRSFAQVYNLEELMHRLRVANHELEQLAGTDALTGTFNRRRFFNALERLIERRNDYGEPFCLLMFDLDHFKSINDTYGHPIGDQVLQQATSCCQIKLRSLDLLGRLGGEEFAVLLPHASLGEALQVAERLRTGLAATPMVTSAGDIRISVSIGVAEFGPEQDAVSLLQAADHQLYAAKNNGRDRVEPAVDMA